MNSSSPFYIRFALILFTIFLLLYGIYIGQKILLPFGFAFLIAVLLQPVEKFFVNRNMPRVVAILLSLLIAVVMLFSLLTFVYQQVDSFVNDIPAIERNLTHLFDNVQIWISKTFHFTRQEQQQVINQAKGTNGDTTTVLATGTLNVLTTSLLSVTLIPIYVFLFMYYRNHLLLFIIHLFGEKHSEKVVKAIREIRGVVHHYVTGLLIETLCVAILNCIGLFLIGSPYIGGLVAVGLTGIIILTNTGDTYIMLESIGVYLIVQFIDNNFFVPRIIGSSVKLNALFSIVAVLVGGALCGIGGMFLSIPFMAVIKVICDHVDDLKPWGMLLGDAESARWHLLRFSPKMRLIKRKSSKPDIDKKAS